MIAKLFTPGPLTTADDVRQAMLEDVGSRTPRMEALTQKLRRELAEVAECDSSFSVVPVQGSGTYAVEAMLSSLLHAYERLLVVANGPYGERMAQICRIHGLNHAVLNLPATAPVSCGAIETALEADPSITHLALIHFETALGVLNDLDAVVALASRRGLRVFVDAMSSFGALPIALDGGPIMAVAASSNKCLHGAPGLGFVVTQRRALDNAPPARSLSLDLAAQYREFEKSGQWRFTPPTHVILALDRALASYRAQGGRGARWAHYSAMADTITTGLAELGITPLIPAGHRAPIIATFLLPFGDEVLSAAQLSQHLMARGFVIYPSVLKERNSFRAGFIGELTQDDARGLVEATRAVLAAHGHVPEPA